MLPWKLRKRQILPVNQNFSSVYFSLAKFQLVSCNLSLAMIWQMTHTHKLLKLCSDTLSACFLVKNTFLVHNLSQPTFRTVKFHVTCAKSERTKKCDITNGKGSYLRNFTVSHTSNTSYLEERSKGYKSVESPWYLSPPGQYSGTASAVEGVTSRLFPGTCLQLYVEYSGIYKENSTLFHVCHEI